MVTVKGFSPTSPVVGSSGGAAPAYVNVYPTPKGGYAGIFTMATPTPVPTQLDNSISAAIGTPTAPTVPTTIDRFWTGGVSTPTSGSTNCNDWSVGSGANGGAGEKAVVDSTWWWVGYGSCNTLRFYICACYV